MRRLRARAEISVPLWASRRPDRKAPRRENTRRIQPTSNAAGWDGSAFQNGAIIFARALSLWLVAGWGCATELTESDSTAASDDVDPLESITPATNESSLATLQRTIFSHSCASIPGQCHFGQFEPNLSTMAQTYYNLVNRGASEHPDQYRVDPQADPSESHIIHKLRGTDGVKTIMPLGSNGLAEEQIQAVEAWIAEGAPWDDKEMPDRPNNPPDPPLIQEWNLAGERLDAGGPILVQAGDTILFRAAVRDLETADADMAALSFSLYAAEQVGSVVLSPELTDVPFLAFATFSDENAPELGGERYNWIYEWTVPEKIDLMHDDGTPEAGIPTAGLVLSIVAFYLDLPYEDPAAMSAITFEPDEITFAEANP